MSYLLHGSSAHTLMGWVDRIPRAGNLFIGGLYALYQTDLIRAAGITHVLSVIDYDPSLREKFPSLTLKHFHIRAQDDPNEDLLQYFEDAVRWMDSALIGDEKEKGGIFVHCAMGKSRSATLVVAYLMWKYKIGWRQGLEWVCEGRPVCEPNLGFREQLGIWEDMLRLSEEGDERKKAYQGWVETRFKGEAWEWEKRAAESERMANALEEKPKL